jgi:hypothetical protein
MAENRTFLLCVDTRARGVSPQNENVRFEQSRNVRFQEGLSTLAVDSEKSMKLPQRLK